VSIEHLAAYWTFGLVFIGSVVFYYRADYRDFLCNPQFRIFSSQFVLLVFAVALAFAALIWPALMFAVFVDEDP
jgi:hypothetical protein